MKIKNLIVCLIVLVCSLLNVGMDFEEYSNLENRETVLIKKEDLPAEFSDEAYMIVIDFIQKTKCLDYEWALFFDYVTGEILRCVKGIGDNVSVDFEDGEFDGYHVSSIHNHPEDVLSPPSHKNFGIFERDFEDYELIAGFEYFWVLKAKGVYADLVQEANNTSLIMATTAFMTCALRYNNNHMIKDMHDVYMVPSY